MNTLSLSKAEIRELISMRKSLPKNIAVAKDGSVDQQGDGEAAVSFFKKFCGSRGLSFKDSGMTSIYAFHSINVHIDGVSSIGSLNVLIPLSGKGELGYPHETRKRDFSYSRFEKWKISVFDDNKPHAFISHSKAPCIALIGCVSKKSYNKFRAQPV